MSDFLQAGPVFSLPLLAAEQEHLERDLTVWTRERPLALLLPCHVRDLHEPALRHIIRTLRETPWVSRIAVGLDGAGDGDFAAARDAFGVLPQPCDLLRHEDHPGAGKGRNLKALATHIIRQGGVFAAAMHDSDIRTYSREFLARLCWPVLHPAAGFSACKGYYARVAGTLHGRLFRLMFQPLLRAWRQLHPQQPWPAFLQSLRYPLSGELCVAADLLDQLTFAPGWGVEVRLLHSLYRTAPPGGICQAELSHACDHKHQEPPALADMAAEVTQTFWMTLQDEGVAMKTIDAPALLSCFESELQSALQHSAMIAEMNGLRYSAVDEGELAARFVAAVRGSLAAASRP